MSLPETVVARLANLYALNAQLGGHGVTLMAALEIARLHRQGERHVVMDRDFATRIRLSEWDVKIAAAKLASLMPDKVKVDWMPGRVPKIRMDAATVEWILP